jgi:hypothetical protein
MSSQTDAVIPQPALPAALPLGGHLAFVCEHSEPTKAGAIPTHGADAPGGGRGDEPKRTNE